MFAVGSALVAIHSLPVASAVGAKIFVVGRKLYSHILVFIRRVCDFQMSGRIVRRICKISVVFSRRIQIIIARDAFECVSAVGKGLDCELLRRVVCRILDRNSVASVGQETVAGMDNVIFLA